MRGRNLVEKMSSEWKERVVWVSPRYDEVRQQRVVVGWGLRTGQWKLHSMSLKESKTQKAKTPGTPLDKTKAPSLYIKENTEANCEYVNKFLAIIPSLEHT